MQDLTTATGSDHPCGNSRLRFSTSTIATAIAIEEQVMKEMYPAASSGVPGFKRAMAGWKKNDSR